MTAPVCPTPTSTQFSLRTAFLVTTGIGAFCAVTAPYLRNLAAEDVRWYGILMLNFAVPALGGLLGARLSIRRKAKRAGELLLTIPGKMKGRYSPPGAALIFAVCVLLGGAFVHATGLIELRGIGLSSVHPMRQAIVLMHLNIGVASYLAAWLVVRWRQAQRTTYCLGLHQHGLTVHGVWYFPWNKVTGFRWRETRPLGLSVWLSTRRLTIEANDLDRDEITAVFSNHGVWGRTKVT